jgi:hypothetical protein
MYNVYLETIDHWKYVKFLGDFAFLQKKKTF